MAGQARPDPLSAAWLASFRDLDHLFDVALSEPDAARQLALFADAAGRACAVLDELMAQPAFAAARQGLAAQDPLEFGAVISQLRAADLGSVIEIIGDLLNEAKIPERSARRITLEAVTGLLTADPALLVGPGAAQVFDQFRDDVCEAGAQLARALDREPRAEAIRGIQAGADGAALAILAAGAAAAAGGAFPAVVAGAGVYLVIRGRGKIRVVLQRWRH